MPLSPPDGGASTPSFRSDGIYDDMELVPYDGIQISFLLRNLNRLGGRGGDDEEEAKTASSSSFAPRSLEVACESE